MSTPPTSPQITVIIPVFNGGDDMEKCLRGVFSNSDVDFECIVVDDASTDGSAQREAARFGARLISLPEQGGPAGARNIGASHASADILFFTDADVVLHPDTLLKALQVLRDKPELAAVFGSYDDNPGHRSFLSRYRNLYHHWTHQGGNREASTFWSGCGAIRKSVFESIGGFSVDFKRPSIEDIELGYRLLEAGHRINLVPDLQGQHLKQWTFITMLRTDIFQRGAPWVALLQRYPDVPPDLNLSLVSRLCTVLSAGLVLCLLLLVLLQPAATLPFLALMLACLLCQGLWARFGGSGAWPIALLATLVLIALPLAAWLWVPASLAWIPLALTAALVFLQLPFFRLVALRQGLAFAMACVPQQILFFLACAVSVPIGLLRYWTSPRPSLEEKH